MSSPVPMVRLPDGKGDLELLAVSSGASGETRPPSVEDLARNTKRAEASHLGSLDLTPLRERVECRCGRAGRDLYVVVTPLRWRSCDGRPTRELFRSLR